jgi:hypothetical protein
MYRKSSRKSRIKSRIKSSRKYRRKSSRKSSRKSRRKFRRKYNKKGGANNPARTLHHKSVKMAGDKLTKVVRREIRAIDDREYDRVVEQALQELNEPELETQLYEFLGHLNTLNLYKSIEGMTPRAVLLDVLSKNMLLYVHFHSSPDNLHDVINESVRISLTPEDYEMMQQLRPTYTLRHMTDTEYDAFDAGTNIHLLSPAQKDSISYFFDRPQVVRPRAAGPRAGEYITWEDFYEIKLRLIEEHRDNPGGRGPESLPENRVLKSFENTIIRLKEIIRKTFNIILPPTLGNADAFLSSISSRDMVGTGTGKFFGRDTGRHPLWPRYLSEAKESLKTAATVEQSAARVFGAAAGGGTVGGRAVGGGTAGGWAARDRYDTSMPVVAQGEVRDTSQQAPLPAVGGGKKRNLESPPPFLPGAGDTADD